MEARTAGKGLRRGQGFAIAGLVAAATAIWVAPLVLGPIGVLCGAAAVARGERRGRWVIVAAVVCMLLGLLLNLLPESFVSS